MIGGFGKFNSFCGGGTGSSDNWLGPIGSLTAGMGDVAACWLSGKKAQEAVIHSQPSVRGFAPKIRRRIA